uniref:Beta-hexosaminidase n=1 Tax=Rhipicephalus microplus TaxID=6941 RepID=A0A6M2CTI3_RHIMP
MASSLLSVLLVLAPGVLTYAFVTYLEVRDPLPGTRPPPGSPWPAPQRWKSLPLQRSLDLDTFALISEAAESCDVIAKAVARYRKLAFLGDARRGSAVAEDDISGVVDHRLLPALRVEVTHYQGEEHCGYPQHEDDESYSLVVPEQGDAVLKSKTVWGALRGLETFSQLVHQNSVSKAFLLNVTMIDDFPRFSYRGILLDSSRHFQPLKIIKQNLDAMAYNKFNAFHWHLVDDQSWPLEMATYPNLTQSAYSPRHVYSRKDVQDVIEYARLRGIRVIPEIDTPGHTQALGKIFPDILTACYFNRIRGKPHYTKHAAFEMLDPTRNYTYDVMRNIFREVIEVFKDRYIHLGMDEVYYFCWESSPEIAEFMKEHGFRTVSQLEQYYVQRTLANVRELGAKYMIWQDPIDNNVNAADDTLVVIWKGGPRYKYATPWQTHARTIARKGYQMVVSACWYLNHIETGPDWKDLYQCDPRGFNGTEQEKNMVVGGEACMWAEYVDGTNLIPRLWPRASAVAERLWSSADVNNTEDAIFRLDQQRCRMLRRGIPAQPISNGYCGDYEWDMDTPYHID